MKDLNYRNIKPVKIDSETHELLKNLKREMSLIEGKDLSMGEVTKRAIKNDEIIRRLITGSKERRLGLK